MDFLSLYLNLKVLLSQKVINFNKKSTFYFLIKYHISDKEHKNSFLNVQKDEIVYKGFALLKRINFLLFYTTALPN
jgi:hypothetical protein